MSALASIAPLAPVASAWWARAKRALLERFPMAAMLFSADADGVVCTREDSTARQFQDWCANCACETGRCKLLSFAGLTKATDGVASNAPENTIFQLKWYEGDVNPDNFILRYANSNTASGQSICSWSRAVFAPPDYCVSCLGQSSSTLAGIEISNHITETFTQEDGVYYRSLLWTIGRCILFFGWESSDTPWECTEEFEYSNSITSSNDLSVVTLEDFQPDPENPIPIGPDFTGIYMVAAYDGTITVTPQACPCVECVSCGPIRFVLDVTDDSGAYTLFVDVQPLADLILSTVYIFNPDDETVIRWTGSFSLEFTGEGCEWVLRVFKYDHVIIGGLGETTAFAGPQTWCCAFVVRQTYTGCPQLGAENWSVDTVSCDRSPGVSVTLDDVTDPGAIGDATCPEDCHSCPAFITAKVTTDFGYYEFCCIKSGCNWYGSNGFGSAVLLCSHDRWYAIIDVTDGAHSATLVFGMIPDSGSPPSCPNTYESGGAYEWETTSLTGTSTGVLVTQTTSDCGDCTLCVSDPEGEDPVNCRDRPQITVLGSFWSQADTVYPGCGVGDMGDFQILPDNVDGQIQCGGFALNTAIGFGPNLCGIAGSQVTVTFTCQITAFLAEKHWVVTVEYEGVDLNGTVTYEDNTAAKCYTHAIWQITSNTVSDFSPGALYVA